MLRKAVGVGRSGYCRYMKESAANRIVKDFDIVSKVRDVHKRVKGKYGSRRMAEQLRDEGYKVGRCKARHPMKTDGVVYKAKRKFKVTTDSKHRFPISPNLLNRSFDVSFPNKARCSDIACLWTKEGWMYLAVVIVRRPRSTNCTAM